MPELNGLDAIRNIRKEFPKMELLVFSMHDSEELVREVFAAGPRGKVMKSNISRCLAGGGKSLARPKTFFTPRTSEAILNTLVSSPGGGAKEITPRIPPT